MNTQDSRGHRHVTESVVHMLRQREFSGEFTRPFQKAAHVTEGMIKRLGLIGQLQGHTGCVNCLEWSDDGRLLMSGSDDLAVIIWDPMRRKKLAVIPTRHIGNIFSVKFLPRTNCSQVVTGAGDTFVTVMNVEYGATKPVNPILHCRCHNGRVKRIATAPDLPDIFWSAGEDGLVLQFDLREPHQCITSNRTSSTDSSVSSDGGNHRTSGGGSILVDLCRHAGWHAEAKCVSVNSTKPHLIAVGANDAYARLFDRRMMKTSPFRLNHGLDFLDRQACLARVKVVDESVPQESAQYFAPGQLTNVNSDENGSSSTRNFKLASTYVTFSPSGNELLVNLGGDHIYLYDINNMEQSFTDKFIKPPSTCIDLDQSDAATGLNPCCFTLSEEFPIKEIQFNETSTKKNSSPVLVPNGIPQCSCEYIRRGDAYLQRKWLGDYYAGARDYLCALNMRGGIKNRKGRRPLIGIVYCLAKLKWWKAAQEWLKLLQQHHGKLEWEYADIQECINKPHPPEPESPDDQPIISISEMEGIWRSAAKDYCNRFVGHCNTTTDIKEAAFIGPTGNYIGAGSDDGVLYIWKRDTAQITTALKADTSIVNCVQPHPSTCLIATSGIETVIKLWQPLSDHGAESGQMVEDIYLAAEANQQRIAMNPFESMIVNLGYEIDMFTPRFQQQMPVCQTS